MNEQVEQNEPLSQQLMPIILGLIVDIIVGAISDLPPVWRVVIIIILGIIYSLLDLTRRRPEQIPISRRAASLMTIALIVAIILVGVAALILGLTVSSIVFLIGWLILMIIFIRIARALPLTRLALRSILGGIAAVSLGAALSMGGGTVLGFVTQGPVQLTIHNDCPTPMLYEPLGIDIPPHRSQTIEVPPMIVTVGQEDDQVFLRLFGLQLPFDLPENVEVIFDGQLIEPGIPLRADLRKRERHELLIICR